MSDDTYDITDDVIQYWRHLLVAGMGVGVLAPRCLTPNLHISKLGILHVVIWYSRKSELIICPMFSLFTFFLDFWLFVHQQWRLSPFYREHILKKCEDCWKSEMSRNDDDLLRLIFARPDNITDELLLMLISWMFSKWKECNKKQARKARRWDSCLQIWNYEWLTHWLTHWLQGDAIASKKWPGRQASVEWVQPDSLRGWTSWTETHFPLLFNNNNTNNNIVKQ